MEFFIDGLFVLGVGFSIIAIAMLAFVGVVSLFSILATFISELVKYNRVHVSSVIQLALIGGICLGLSNLLHYFFIG